MGMLEEPPTRKHTEIQMLLAQLGRKVGCGVWIPSADQGGSARGTRLSEYSVGAFPPLPVGDQALKIIQNIDVVWIRKKTIEAAFEVESTTSIYSGLLRLSDLLASQPNINVRLFLLAERRRRDEVRRNILRPTFSDLDLPNRVRFISFETIVTEFDGLMRYAETSGILDRISEDLAQPEGERPEPTPKEEAGPKKAKITWKDKLAWADPRVEREFLPQLLEGVNRSIGPGMGTKVVGRWLYIQHGKTFCVLWVKKRGFIVSVPADQSFRDPKQLSHPVKGFFFPQGHERRFSFVIGDDMEYALRLIGEGHRIAQSPGYPWSGTRRPTRTS